MTYSELVREADAYYRLCAKAERLNIPVALNDPASPQTVEALRTAVEEAEV